MKSWNEISKAAIRREYTLGGQLIYWYSTDYDLLGRPTNATDSVSLAREWLYNSRSELAAASIGTNLYGYSYDTIGNRLWSADNMITNCYAANSLNQYTTVGRAVPSAPQTSLAYDADGNMTRDGTYVYSYDAENRLRSVTSRTLTNGAPSMLVLRIQRQHLPISTTRSLMMPPDLVKAHAHLDALVDKVYGLSPSVTDAERVALLFKLYAEKVKEAK